MIKKSDVKISKLSTAINHFREAHNFASFEFKLHNHSKPLITSDVYATCDALENHQQIRVWSQGTPQSPQKSKKAPQIDEKSMKNLPGSPGKIRDGDALQKT